MDLTHYRSLGASGLAVSRLCLGTMGFGDPQGIGCDSEQSGRLLDHYADLGGNFIDTANIYAGGRSESIIGDHLAANPSRRQQLVIATKFSANLGMAGPNAGGASRGAIIAACEASLRRLRTDHIDLYWQHWEDPFVPIEETMRALDDLVRAGKVRYIGFSDTSAWKTAKAQLIAGFRGWSSLIAVQFEYSLLERTGEGELVPMAIDQNLGIMPWGPLRGGMLTGKYRPDQLEPESPGRKRWVKRDSRDEVFALLEALDAVALENGSTPSRVALAWLMSRPGVVSPIMGARRIEQIDDNVAALAVTLSGEQLASLDRLSAPALAFPAEFLKLAHGLSYGGNIVNGRTYRAIQPG